VITQVNSGNKQFLPRLGAEIIGLRQSKSGSLYAASLSNNSIKIISAADLELRSEISGIHISSNPVPKREQRTSFHRSSVALLHPHRPQIYVNGAAINTSSGTLQSYDLGVDQQSLRLGVARVTRTKWTGKQKRPVFEPALTFAALTGDGTWLATIDEWENQYGFGDMDSIEIYLKFWAWKGKQWELVAKIDSPHGSDRRVLGLASPSQLSSVQEFATLGADGSVKIWRPSVQAHGQSSETVWSLHRTYGSHKLVPASEGSFKYSPDNSVLVAGLESDIHVIDAQNGHVAKSFHAGKSISEVGIVGRHLLCLHDNSSLFSCWDIATGQILFTERIHQPYATIAVNHGTSTFALSTSTTIKSTITISKIKSNKKIDEAEIRIGSVVTNLLGSDLSELSGFIFVDDAGQVGHVAAQAISNPSITNNTSEPVSSIIPVQVRQVEDGRESASSRPIGQTNRILDQDIKSALENEDLGIARMYETIVQSIG
jgi:NET1-associated nuclear protein 1 (U3 small nucleolar RNA-associated protein 17)